MNIIALDPGYGNTKVCLNGQTGIIQSSIARPITVGSAGIGMGRLVKANRISFDHNTYVIGKDAWQWGTPISSKDFAALASPERKALFLGALSTLIAEGRTSFDGMVIGLPVPLLRDQQQFEAVKVSLKRYENWETGFTVNDKKYEIQLPAHIKVIAQPVGAFMDWLMDDSLRVRKIHPTAQIAILDIGMNTLDLFVVENGQMSPRYLGGEKVGMRRLFELMDDQGRDVEELDAYLRRGQIKASESQMQTWLNQILGVVETTWPRLSRFTAVIATGGGVMALGNLLERALIARGAALEIPANPLLANVKGLWKWRAKADADEKKR